MSINVKKWRPIGRDPITKNGTLQVKAHGVEYRNTGDLAVLIDGFWHVEPYETKYFGMDGLDLVLEHEFRFEFAEGTGTKRVEVAEMVFKNFDYDV